MSTKWTICTRCWKSIQSLRVSRDFSTSCLFRSSRAPQQASDTNKGRLWNPFAWYNAKLKKNPLITKSLTSAALFGLGDVLAQKYMGVDTLNKQRILRGAIYGGLILGPLAHWHFAFLEWLTVRKLALGPKTVPFVKMFIDQFVYWAPGILIVYHTSMGLMEGKNLTQCKERLKLLYWTSLKANYCIWPFVMVVNFAVIPVAHQLNFALVFGLAWATILSYISASKPQEQQIPEVQ